MFTNNTDLENSQEVNEKIRKIAEEAIKQDKLTEEEEEKLKKLYLQYLSEEEYNDQSRQEQLFNQDLLELIKKYSGMYIWFEDGQVIDYDADEEVLLDRLEKNDIYKSRNYIYVRQVPEYTF